MSAPFERHDIRNLSASSVNLWVAQPALWGMEKLLKRRSPVGTVAHRGSAIEAGVEFGLRNLAASIEECQQHALADFDRRAALSGDKNREKHREAVAPAVALGVAELRQYGTPDTFQERLEVMLPDIPVPFVGYSDFRWQQHNIVLDLKSGEKLPTRIVDPHARQGCIYVHGTDREMRFCYATPKKLAVYRLEDPQQHLNSLQRIAKSIERFLSISNDPHELMALLTPDYESFYWADPVTRSAGREVFGF